VTAARRPAGAALEEGLDDRPDWYRDAIVYEVHLRAFQDSDDDGIGDFDGLTSRLDYLQDLGVTAIWLLPFYPSPLRDDGYDTGDFEAVHPDFGDVRAVHRLLREAHQRGLRVITELVLNHTSDTHPWFRRARRDRPGGHWREFYVWSDSADRYAGARVIFQDYEHSNWTWDPEAGAYYWHRFYSHQPDLNYDNAAVHEAMFEVVDFWMQMGVDGMRLDAVPYLYEREGTNCENLPETHAFLRALRRHVDERYPNRMLLAEANQWPEDAVAYFGDDDECHMAFQFPLMPRLFMALQMEDHFPVADILEQTPRPPGRAQWATFLRNHDELTLEMVTDEERDYMYRSYAADPQMRVNLGIRRRLAPLLGNDRRKIELLNGLLFSLPGTPVIYYGDEIGMGDNVYLGDRDGVRTPMQWSSDRNAGFSRSNPQRLYLPVIIDPEYHYENLNVDAQAGNASSLLRWMRQLITLRRRFPVFGRGELTLLHPENPKILAFVREDEDTAVLVVANLSRAAQFAELELNRFAGMTPVELFGNTEFPPVGELPYLVTLGPHSFHWFALERRATEAPVHSPPRADLPALRHSGRWQTLFEGRSRRRIAQVLPQWLEGRRWFAGKGRAIADVEIVDVLPLTSARGGEAAFLVLARVDFREGEPAIYALPLAVTTGDRARHLLRDLAHGVVARLDRAGDAQPAALSEAIWEPGVCRGMLESFRHRRPRKGSRGELATWTQRTVHRGAPDEPEPQLLRAEQSNSSIVYGHRFILKLFRRLEPGPNPELEIGRFLRDQEFPHVPALVGAMEYRVSRREPTTVAVLQELVPNEGDLWTVILDTLERFYEDVAGVEVPSGAFESAEEHVLDLIEREPPEELVARATSSLQRAALLGERTAGLHRVLGADTEAPTFGRQPITALYRRSLFQSMRSLTMRTSGLLRKRLGSLPEDTRELASNILERREEITERFDELRRSDIDGMRIRIHGDFHLGQVLFTGRDFVILDFEGEPLRSIGERRLRRSPLRDVAGMLRSYDYVAQAALARARERGVVPDSTDPGGEAWARLWNAWVAAAFLRAYLGGVEDAGLLPTDRAHRRLLLDALVLEKSVYELAYELEQRPEWVRLPLLGLLRQLDVRR